jgi:hypothetical protein
MSAGSAKKRGDDAPEHLSEVFKLPSRRDRRSLHPRAASGQTVHLRHAFDSRRLSYPLPYRASGARRRKLLEIAVVRVQGAKARTVHSNAENDLNDSGLTDDSWRHRQDDTFSVY